MLPVALASTVLVSVIAAGPAEGFAVDSLEWIDAATRAGDSLYVTTDTGLYEVERGAEAPRRISPVMEGTLVAATALTDPPTVATARATLGPIRVVGPGGERALELPDGAQLSSLVVEGDGSVLALDVDADVVWRWTVADPEPRALAGESVAVLLPGPRGEIWRLSDDGRRSRLDAEGWAPWSEPPPELGDEDRVSLAWWSQGTGRLWMTTSRELLALRPDGAVVERHELALSPRFLDGRSTATGDVVMVGDWLGSMEIVGGGRAHYLEGEPWNPSAMILDLERREVLVAERRRFGRVSIAEAFEDPDDPSSSVREHRPRRGLDVDVLPWLFVGMGPRWDLSPSDRVRYHLDAELGALLIFEERRAEHLLLLPALGYALDRSDPSQHAFTAGLGVGGFWPTGGFAVRPTLLAGGSRSGPSVGLRSGLLGYIGAGLVSVEVSHQVRWIGPRPAHSIVLSFGTNLAAALLVGTVVALKNGAPRRRAKRRSRWRRRFGRRFR